MNKTFLGPDAKLNTWFFQISTDPQFNHTWKSHFVTIEFGSALEIHKVVLCYEGVPKDLPDAAAKFLTQARELFAKVPTADALENSEAFCALVEAYAKKQKMVQVTNNGRPYLANGPFNFTFKYFEARYAFSSAFQHANSFGLTFSGHLSDPDEHQPGSNHSPDDDLPVILQIFTRVIRRKTVLHAQLSRLSKKQIPNKPPAFEALFQMEYK